MKKINPYAVFGVSVILIIASYYLYKKTSSKKAIQNAKDDELAQTQTSTTPEIPKMYIRAGTGVPAGAMSFIDNTQNSFR